MLDYSDFPVTNKLYHEDPYLQSCEATVLGIDDRSVVFDRTIFYAESGGQASDSGTVEGLNVVDVKKEAGRWFTLPNFESAKIDGVIRHELEEAPSFKIGQSVRMELDWSRRYYNMQMHTLAHFLFIATGEYLEKIGRARTTRGCHIEGDSARFDFVGSIQAEAIDPISDRIRELVAHAGHATSTKIEGTNEVLIWSSAGVDIPCGGTHVVDSSEIVGEVSVRRRSKGKGLTRLYVSLQRPRQQGT